jgi:hypothetical protein
MQRNSSQSTLLLLVLREIRLDNLIHPGQLAHFTGKTPKEWENIESGKSPLTLQLLTNASFGLLQAPSHVMFVAEQLAQAFNRHGWYFQTTPLGKDDELMPFIDSYFDSKGYEALRARPIDRISVNLLNMGMGMCGYHSDPSIVRYCCDPEFKNWIDAGAQSEMPPTVDTALGL